MAELDNTGSKLLYASYFGPTGNNTGGIAVDSSGDAYLTGGASAFAIKINPAAAGPASLVYSFSVGGTGTGNGIAIDAAGDAYVTGRVISSGFPITPGTLPAAGTTAFVAEVNPYGAGLVYSTLLGGGSAGLVRSNAIAVDGAGDAYVVGQARIGALFTTPGAFEPTSPGNTTGFMAELNPTATGLIYSTYFGGSGSPGYSDEGKAITLDAAGHVYLTGQTYSSDFPP